MLLTKVRDKSSEAVRLEEEAKNITVSHSTLYVVGNG